MAGIKSPSKENMSDLIEDYRNGCYVWELSDKYDVSEYEVVQVLMEAGVYWAYKQ